MEPRVKTVRQYFTL